MMRASLALLALALNVAFSKGYDQRARYGSERAEAHGIVARS
jgi:hypothetical protein